MKDAHFLVPNHQKYLQFHWQGDPLPVSVSSIQPVMLPLNFHQNDETGSGFLERERNTSHYLPQRSVSSLQLSGHSKEPGVIYKGSISGTRPADQRQEVPIDTNPRDSISRVSTIQMEVFLPKEKLSQIQKQAGRLGYKTTTMVQQIATFVGMT